MATPLFEVIKKYLVTKVEKGLWLPGDAVPSENQLAEKYSVSRMTARRALTELTESGVLVRVRGSGTFVADQLPTGSLLEIRTIDSEIKDRGHSHEAIVIDLEQQKASQNVAYQLGIDVNSEVFFSRVLHLEVDTQGLRFPIQVEERYVLRNIAPNYLAQDFSKITPSAYLSSLSPLSEAEHWVEAILANESTQALLEIDNSIPCLKLSRRTYSYRTKGSKRQKQIVNYAMLYHPGNRYRLGGHLTAKTSY